MKIITIIFGILLFMVGVGSFMATGATHPTALAPALFGVAICVLGIIERPERGSKNHAFFSAVFLAILTFLGSLRGLISLLGGDTTTITPAIITGLCVLFVILAVSLTPNFWQGWKAFGHFLGNLIARVVLTFFYFTIFVPFALGVKLFSDPLHLKSVQTRLWQNRTTGDQTLEEVLRQF